MRKVSFVTLGCRVNQYESDAIAESLEKEGFVVVPFGEKCDVTVINTCSVTAESDRKSRQIIRKAVRNGTEYVIVTGCSSQIFTDETKEIEGLSAIFGNGEKDKITAYIKDCFEKENSQFICDVGNIDEASYDTLKISHARRARAYVKIEDGCENKCAYCIIPKARGKVRSKAENKIIAEVTEIAETCPEIILTGIETASYGRDRKEKNALADLLKRVDAIDGVSRLTVGSLDPNILTEDFLETIINIPSFMPHLHMSIQSGSTGVLNRMRRKYSAEKALERLLRAKEVIPDLMLTADIIVGFPGETEEEFSETVEFCKKARFMHIHIFPYSKRRDTEACTMQCQVKEEIKHERARRLAEIQAEIKKDILENYVKKFSEEGTDVLFEQQINGVNIGHSRHYIEVRCECEENLSDRIINMKLTGTDGTVCFAEPV